MIQTLRALVALAMLGASVVSSEEANATEAMCAIDGVRAVDDMLDGVVFTLASIARCNKERKDEAQCISDVSAVIESVNKVVNVIVEAVDQCGAIKTEKPKCGMAIGKLTEGVAALTSASAGIVAKCPSNSESYEPGEKSEGGFPTECVVNIKDSVKSLLKAVRRSVGLSDKCKEPGSLECVNNAIKLADALVGLAEYISGAVGHCSMKAADAANGQCAEVSMEMTHAAGEVGEAGSDVAEACEPTEAERLYLDRGMAVPAMSNLAMGLNIGLVAMLPVTAVGAFVAGKRLYAVNAMQPLPDEEMLMQPVPGSARIVQPGSGRI